MKTFIEIGSCDFDTLNYLSDYGWRGVIVEPIPKYFNNLEKKHNIIYVNAAIYHHDGTTIMYTADESVTSKDSDYRGMSTMWSGGNELINTPIEVNTITVNTLLNNCGIECVDYLKIDAEAFDHEILKMWPWDAIAPKVIKCEIEHDGGSETLDILKENGYHCEVEDKNVYAIKL